MKLNIKLLLVITIALTAVATHYLSVNFKPLQTPSTPNLTPVNSESNDSVKTNGLYITEDSSRGYNFSVLDINNDGKDEIIMEDMSASFWKNTFILTIEQEPVREWDSYKPKLTLYCKTCRFYYWNGHTELKDLNGDGIYELIVTGGIEIPGSTSSETEYREETYFFENGDFIKKDSKIIDRQ